MSNYPSPVGFRLILVLKCLLVFACVNQQEEAFAQDTFEEDGDWTVLGSPNDISDYVRLNDFVMVLWRPKHCGLSDRVQDGIEEIKEELEENDIELAKVITNIGQDLEPEKMDRRQRKLQSTYFETVNLVMHTLHSLSLSRTQGRDLIAC